jgi:hypothetical protein
VTDLGSTNGVRVNQVRVRSAPLEDGDSLQIGQCVYRFQVGGGHGSEVRGDVRGLLVWVTAVASPGGG